MQIEPTQLTPQTYKPYGLPNSCLGLPGPYRSQLTDLLVSLVAGPDSQLPWYLATMPLIQVTGSPVCYLLAIAHRCTHCCSLLLLAPQGHKPLWSMVQLQLLAMRPPYTHKCTQTDPASPSKKLSLLRTQDKLWWSGDWPLLPLFYFFMIVPSQITLIPLLSLPLSPPLNQ